MPLPPEVERPAFRRDLQGARGLGITFVVVGHFFHWPPVAYAAMDMFFVLSGFLITGILIAALPRFGGRFLAVFYLGRIRRLVPAALTVLLVSTLLFYVLVSRERGDQVASDAMLAAVWVINWRYALSGTDYFAAEASNSPLVHYWSLSVEEQFYLVWPVLILLVLFLARRRRSPELALLVGLGAVTVVTFGYSCWHSATAPVEAYYSTLDRTWEFGVGGLVAVLAARLARLPFWAGFVLGWGGVIGLIVSLFLLPADRGFPAPWALVPVLMTVGVLAGGINRDTRYLWILDNPPIIYLGDISYSVYLWHLPVNLLVLPMFPGKGVEYYVSALSITLVLAVATYHLLERPMRHATWLMTPPERKRARAADPRPPSERRPGWIALGLAPALVLSVVALAPVQLVASPPRPVSSVTEPVSADPLVARQQERIIAALEQTEFPELDPPPDQLSLEKWYDAMAADGCVQSEEVRLDGCRLGPETAKRTAVVVGDSKAMAWAPGIGAALEPRGWSVRVLSMFGCPAWTLASYVHYDGTPFPECAAGHQLVTDYLLENTPDLVVLASAAAHVRNAERPGFPEATELARTGTAATLTALEPSGARIVVLGDYPNHADLVTCKTRISTPEACVTHPSELWRFARDGEEAAAHEAGVTYVDTSDWFCYLSRCPAFVGTTPVTVDGDHLSIAFARSLAPLLRDALVTDPG